MTLPDEPDVVQAFIDYTLTLTNTSQLVRGQVSGRLRTKSTKDPSGWKMPDYAIVYRAVPGPSRSEPGQVPLVWETLQVECYGPTLRESRRLWRVLRKEFFPDNVQQVLAGQQVTPHGFVAAGCAVVQFQVMGSAAPLQQTPEDFPRTVVSLFAQYCTDTLPVS